MLRRIAFVLLAVLVLFLIPVSISSQFRDATVRVVRPFGHAVLVRNLSLRAAWLNLRSIPSLRQQKEALQEENLALIQQISDQEELQRENDVLRGELGVTGVTRAATKLAAQVVVRDTNASDPTLTVDIGSQQGVKVGQAAVVKGFLIGTVLEVRANSAVVRSISSPRSNVEAWITDNREKGLITGNGAGQSVLNNISQGISVPDRAIVETSGLGGSLPQGIVIGTIERNLSKPSDPSLEFLVSLAQDPDAVESLFILTSD